MDYHILNGDALKGQFPSEIPGQLIVARECLVDGDVSGESLSEFFETRAKFLSESYPDIAFEDYAIKSIPEFEKMCAIPERASIYLWFEFDLFCQVNLWFVVWLLRQENKSQRIFLVCPDDERRCGFGGMSEEDLKRMWNCKMILSEELCNTIASLWLFYRSGNAEGIHSLISKDERLAFMLPASEAYLRCYLPELENNRPKQILLEIMEEIGTIEFAPVFQQFCKRAAIYGFGDLQVYRLWQSLKD